MINKSLILQKAIEQTTLKLNSATTTAEKDKYSKQLADLQALLQKVSKEG